MKKRFLLFVLIIFTSFHYSVYSQPSSPGWPDPNTPIGQGATADIYADKYIAELGETINLTIKLVLVDHSDPQHNIHLYDYRPVDSATAPWKISNWKIQEGGGELITPAANSYYAILHAPLQMPANKCIVLTAELNPQISGYSKIILYRTIYLRDNEIVFYYNCPAYGIIQEKYVVNNNGGILNVPAMPNNAATQNNQQLKDLQLQLQQTQQLAKNAVAAKGYDVTALTSNARAVYVAEKNITTITIQGDDVQMANGVAVHNKRKFMISLSFPGAVAGSFKVKSKPEISSTILLVSTAQVCGCNDDPVKPGQHPSCRGGTIYIEAYNRQTGIIKGTVFVNMEGAVGSDIIYGDMEGKFTVKLANQ